MQVKENHNLGSLEAKNRVLQFGEKIKTEYSDKISNYSENWNGNEGIFNMSIMGQKIEGKIEIAENFVTIEGSVPFMLKFFESQIESTIRKSLQEILKI